MLASAPTIRSYPQPEFSRAILAISASRSCPIRGRPGYLRFLEPSNLLAISLRYQTRMVAGLATRATSARALRPSRLPISASVDLSGLDKRSRGRQVRSHDPVFRSQVLILEEQFLVDQTSHIRQQAQPLVVPHAERP